MRVGKEMEPAMFLRFAIRKQRGEWGFSKEGGRRDRAVFVKETLSVATTDIGLVLRNFR